MDELTKRVLEQAELYVPEKHRSDSIYMLPPDDEDEEY